MALREVKGRNDIRSHIEESPPALSRPYMSRSSPLPLSLPLFVPLLLALWIHIFLPLFLPLFLLLPESMRHFHARVDV
jgi:hypothetical protein